ncbi:hypothetical protein HDE_02852 [Halotydeus destructor]|nr:hypothetical protein HDE_02852 [Halotydeus destructor]
MNTKIAFGVLVTVILGVYGQTSYETLDCAFLTTSGFQFCDYNATLVTVEEEEEETLVALTSQPVTIPDPICYRVFYFARSSNFTVSSINQVTGEKVVLYQEMSFGAEMNIANLTLQSTDPIRLRMEQSADMVVWFTRTFPDAC